MGFFWFLKTGQTMPSHIVGAPTEGTNVGVDDPLPVTPSGRAYSDPIQLTLNGGALVVPGGGSITSDPVDRGGYDSMLITWVSGTMTTIQPVYADTVNGVYAGLALGLTAAGVIPPPLNLSAALPRREIGNDSGLYDSLAYTYSSPPLIGGRWVKFICVGTAAQTLVINIMLATMS